MIGFVPSMGLLTILLQVEEEVIQTGGGSAAISGSTAFLIAVGITLVVGAVVVVKLLSRSSRTCSQSGCSKGAPDFEVEGKPYCHEHAMSAYDRYASIRRGKDAAAT